MKKHPPDLPTFVGRPQLALESRLVSDGWWLAFNDHALTGVRSLGVLPGANARNALIKLGLGDEFDEQSTQIPSTIYFEWRLGAGDDQKLIATVRKRGRE